jgi:hypothetical protein
MIQRVEIESAWLTYPLDFDIILFSPADWHGNVGDIGNQKTELIQSTFKLTLSRLEFLQEGGNLAPACYILFSCLWVSSCVSYRLGETILFGSQSFSLLASVAQLPINRQQGIDIYRCVALAGHLFDKLRILTDKRKVKHNWGLLVTPPVESCRPSKGTNKRAPLVAKDGGRSLPVVPPLFTAGRLLIYEPCGLKNPVTVGQYVPTYGAFE